MSKTAEPVSQIDGMLSLADGRFHPGSVHFFLRVWSVRNRGNQIVMEVYDFSLIMLVYNIILVPYIYKERIRKMFLSSCHFLCHEGVKITS